MTSLLERDTTLERSLKEVAKAAGGGGGGKAGMARTRSRIGGN